MVQMNISSNIQLTTDGLPARTRQAILADLTIENQDYRRAEKYGRRTHSIPPTIALYAVHGDALILPRGYGRTLQELLAAHHVQYNVTDQRLILPRVAYGRPTVQLRPYQLVAVDALVRGVQGGLEAPCGSGKTITGLATIVQIGQPALWITHTRELAEQTREAACKFFGMAPQEIEFIGGGQKRTGERLTVALVQTLAKIDGGTLEGKYGTVFVDEAQHLPAKSLFDTVGRFPARYRLWASATPTRADGKTMMIYAAGGPILHTITQSEVPTIIPHLEVVETAYRGHSPDWQPLLADLIQDEKRNALIADAVAENTAGHYSLVLSERVEHLHILRELLANRLRGVCIEVLTGDMSKRERRAIMTRAKAGEVDILLAANIAKEGLDIPHLDRLFVTGALRAQATVQQEVGRVMRPAEGKADAVVYDFHDAHSPILHAQFRQRRSVYERLGMLAANMSTRKAVR